MANFVPNCESAKSVANINGFFIAGTLGCSPIFYWSDLDFPLRSGDEVAIEVTGEVSTKLLLHATEVNGYAIVDSRPDMVNGTSAQKSEFSLVVEIDGLKKLGGCGDYQISVEVGKNVYERSTGGVCKM